ncbi:hypothetical protein CYMTET_35512, partial [Cymbomonas tetramitiformis]
SEYVVVVYRNFAPPPPPLPPPSPSPPPPSPPPPPLEVQASVKLRLRFPSGDAGNLPRDFRQEYQATMDTVQPVALRETLVTQTYAGSVVVESDTTYTSTDGADDFYAAAKCCIADYFAEVDFFDLYGPPELLEGQVVYFVPMPSPKDEYDIAAQGWFWGILCAFVILGALTAAVIQFNKHRAATLLQVDVTDPFDQDAPEKQALVPAGGAPSNIGGGRVVPLDDTTAPPATPPSQPPPSTLSTSEAPVPPTPDYTSAGEPVAESMVVSSETPPPSLRLPPKLVPGTAGSVQEASCGVVNMPVPGWSSESSTPNAPRAN